MKYGNFAKAGANSHIYNKLVKIIFKIMKFAIFATARENGPTYNDIERK